VKELAQELKDACTAGQASTLELLNKEADPAKQSISITNSQTLLQNEDILSPGCKTKDMQAESNK
jgi:hypothetical protein